MFGNYLYNLFEVCDGVLACPSPAHLPFSSWARQFTPIPDSDITVIKRAQKSQLFNNGQAWTKKSSASTFDVTMGSFDGAEICELVGLFILESLKKRFGSNVGLYRDDGLGAIETSSGRLADKARKDLVGIFASYGLKITAQTNLKQVNFLDITFDLTNGTYKPYRKPNDEPLYINSRSNHPPPILRQLPLSINKRINKLSCNEQTFNETAPLYNDALKRSNFNFNLTYEPPSDNGANNNANSQRTRRRNTIWYNPPYSKNVITNIGRNFLQLVDKHFPRSHKLHQIFNRHIVRVSYSCMDNMKTVIQQHNKRILSQHAKQNQQRTTNRQTQTNNQTQNHTNNQPQTNNNNRNQTNNTTRTCNCRKRTECPMAGKCLAKSLVYQAEVKTSSNRETRRYIGVTANEFKERYRNHLKSFQHKKYASNTELSKHVWKLKDSNQHFTIKWSVIKRVPAYRPGSKRCNLCLEEKLLLMKGDHCELLNKRNELFARCRHVTKHQLK